MTTIRLNGLDQALDILGTLAQSDQLNVQEEPLSYGQAFSSGTDGSINFSGTIGTLSGTDLTTNIATITSGQFVTIAGSAGNNGTYLIIAVGSTTIDYSALTGSTDTSGTISYTIREPYSLQDDLNYARTDRRLIKGTTHWYDPVPTVTHADGTTSPASLTNLATLTTSAKNVIVSELVVNQATTPATTKITIPFASFNSDTWITTSSVKTGIPVINAGLYAGDIESCFVIITDTATGNEVRTTGSTHSDDRLVFGVTTKDAAQSAGQVDVLFYSVAPGDLLSNGIPYTWTATDPTHIGLAYPHSYRLDQVPAKAFRRVLTLGLMSDADLRNDINNLQSLIGLADETTSINSSITNTGNYYPLSTLPSNATVIAALNALNNSVGNMTFTGSILTSGTTITQALQDLANAAAAVKIVRIIERLGATGISANTPHTIPFSSSPTSYIKDSSNNGSNLWVYTRGLLRDPGSITDRDDYAEVTGGTQITFFFPIKAYDHINYFIKGS